MRPTGRQAEFVFERANGCCEYCHLPQIASSLTFHIDHIVPESVGGDRDMMNLALACPGCNLNKQGKWVIFDRGTRSEVKLFNPRIDVWSDHFETREFGIILPLTLTGSVTVHMLKMNDFVRMLLRKMAIQSSL